jgi:alpha-L-rhamnosidase
MAEVYTGWFEVSNMTGPPGTAVYFSVSSTAGIVEEYGMADSFTFGPSGAGSFKMFFSYHEIEFITVTGSLTSELVAADVVGFRLSNNLTRTGSFECSSKLITKMYDTTVNNYVGITTGGMSVDCPHRERRGYGGDGHSSYQFALQNFGVGAFFNKWTRDFADVQGEEVVSSGDIPNTAPTVSGGGGPAWSGYAITNPWQTYLATGDTGILGVMYPTMVRQLAFWSNHTWPSDGLLHPWTESQWNFLGDWITPHGSETNVTSPANLLFNTCYCRYVTYLTSKVAGVLGHADDAARYEAAATRLAGAINKAFYDEDTGLYVDGLQTHQVMPLASGVVDPALEARSMGNLEHAILVDTGTTTPAGHLDTGLTGTYMMTKLLTDSGRNDLIFHFANKITFPGYGYFLSQGYTTWPEDWNVTRHDVSSKSGVSKMHGCYNSIGLWFVQGLAGIVVDASDPLFPIRVRAGVDAGDISWVSGSRMSPAGMVHSSWSMTGGHAFSHNVTIPANAAGGAARVMIPAASAKDVTEGGVPVTEAKGVSVIGTETVNKVCYVVLKVGSGRYGFASRMS